MFKLIVVLSIISSIQCDITNLSDFLNVLKQNKTIPLGYMTKANIEVVKRYLTGNVNMKKFDDKSDMLRALDNETIYGRRRVVIFKNIRLLFQLL